MTMQGAPATLHVTSPASSLSSETVSVVEIVPLMPLAYALAPQTRSPSTEKTEMMIRLERNRLIGPPYAVLKVAMGTGINYGVVGC